MSEIITNSLDETLNLGSKIARRLKGGEIFGLNGELGSGKTAFVRGVALGLNYKGYVKSPTFTIINQYNTDSLTLVHIDIYRISTYDELLLAGFESYLRNDTVIMIEWFSKLNELLSLPHIRVDFEYLEENRRRIVFEPDYIITEI